MNYGKAIRIARSISGLSQAKLADMSGIDRSYLSLIESGGRKPSMESLLKISGALKLPFHLLTLLATEKEDTNSIGNDQILNLATELTKLLLEQQQDYDQLSLEYSDRRKSKQARVSARNKKGDAA
jgi:transcriptional regulator with XRE-family HTH domain